MKRKNVFVSGGTSGINLAIAQSFAESGANVGVLSRSQEKVDCAVDILLALGGADSAAGWAADRSEERRVGKECCR